METKKPFALRQEMEIEGLTSKTTDSLRELRYRIQRITRETLVLAHLAAIVVARTACS